MEFRTGPPGLHARGPLGRGAALQVWDSARSHTWGRIPRRSPLIGRLGQVVTADQSEAARPWAARSAQLAWSLGKGVFFCRAVPGKGRQIPGDVWRALDLASESAGHLPSPALPHCSPKEMEVDCVGPLLGSGSRPHASSGFCSSCASCCSGAPTFRSSCSSMAARKLCFLSEEKPQCPSSQALPLHHLEPPFLISQFISVQAVFRSQLSQFDQIWWHFINFAAPLRAALDSVDLLELTRFPGTPTLVCYPSCNPFSMGSYLRHASPFFCPANRGPLC